MQQREIISMIDAKRVDGIAKYEELDELALRFPYCSTFQVLRAIGLKERDSIDFKTQLNRASIAIADRSKLYEYTIKQNLLTRIQDSQVKFEELETDLSKESTAVTKGAETKSSHSSKEELIVEVPTDDAPLASKDRETQAPDSEQGTSESDSASEVFKTKVLEDEIMRAAISHLGEIEADVSLQELSDPSKNTPIPDPTSPMHSDEPMSFGAWLLKKSSSKESKVNASREIIDKFIQESPQISPVKTAFFSPSQMGKMSLIEDESFVTETLAKIYERQGDFKKAAIAYKNLGLKFPEKSTYFAHLQKRAEEHLKS